MSRQATPAPQPPHPRPRAVVPRGIRFPISVASQGLKAHRSLCPRTSLLVWVILFIGLGAACTSTEDLRFGLFKNIDSVAAYEQFLDMYPHSKHADWINQRTREIREQKEAYDTRQVQDIEIKSTLLGKYALGVLTTEQFFHDGWDARSPFFGKAGIVGGMQVGDSLRLIIGTYEQGSVPRKVSITRRSVPYSSSAPYSSSFSWEYRGELTPQLIQTLADAHQDRFEYFLSSEFFWLPELGHRLGEVVFKNNILVSKPSLLPPYDVAHPPTPPLKMSPEAKAAFMYTASGRGDMIEVMWLLRQGAAVDARVGKHVGTPLFAAAMGGHADVVKLLLAKGAEINAATSTALAPVFAASMEGHAEVLRILIDAGADVHGTCGASSLRIASKRGHAEVTKLLERARAENPPPPGPRRRPP